MSPCGEGGGEGEAGGGGGDGGVGDAAVVMAATARAQFCHPPPPPPQTAYARPPRSYVQVRRDRRHNATRSHAQTAESTCTICCRECTHNPPRAKNTTCSRDLVYTIRREHMHNLQLRSRWYAQSAEIILHVQFAPCPLARSAFASTIEETQ